VKDFFNNHLYNIIKMFVNQIAISIFGFVLFAATSAAEVNGTSSILTIVVSCCAILFYLFLIYTMIWDIGAKDKTSVDVGKKPSRPYTGLILALVANIPNYLIAIAYTIAYPFMANHAWAGNTAGVAQTASLFIQGMYRGLISSVSIGSNKLSHFWWVYFIIIIPSLVTSWLGYFLGHKNFRFFAFITKKFNKTEEK